MSHYPDVDPNPNFAELEEKVLTYWQENGLFEQSVAARPATSSLTHPAPSSLTHPACGGGKGGALSTNSAGGESPPSIPPASGVEVTNNEFVFYDGPPFANGLPHYGHLLTGYVKDAIARYQTMRGKRVERRFGWDCHGLPAEMGSEKELGISGRQAIQEFGIKKFNEHCRTSVMKYTDQWEYYVDRQGRWVDFKNDYKTMDKNFMESVLWAFKQLYDKGYVYEAYRVMPYSWAAETPLSNFETKLDNSYREREDKAITVAFELNEIPQKIMGVATSLRDAINENIEAFISSAPTEETKTELKKFKDAINCPIESAQVWAWTTTPWTLPSNLALATSADVSYIAIPIEGKIRLLSTNAANAYKKELSLPSTFVFGSVKDRKIEGKADFAALGAGIDAVNKREPNLTIDEKFFLNGKDLIGLTYKPLFPYFADLATPVIPSEAEGSRDSSTAPATSARSGRNDGGSAFRILDGSNFVTDTDGTGIVHMAPGFGEEDQKCCEKNGIELVVPVDGQGKFTDEIFDLPVIPSEAEGSRDSSTAPATSAGSGRNDELPPLKLAGLNVIAQTTGKCEAEPYTETQLAKYGLVNLRIIQWLKMRGLLIKQEDFKHNYPHCWRTDQPLIYRAMPSWYVAVTKFKDRAVELNREINWIPSHIGPGQMAHMLATAPDWSISRNRFWGTPIPVWRREDSEVRGQDSAMKVFGSIAELEDFFDLEACFNADTNPESRIPNPHVEDLHRPYIDQLTIAKDGSKWKRVEDVFDCWFESGSMPFAQVHYPFENKDWFESHFPADFITEYVGQTRGWFNTLIMLSTALFDKPPFKNCICHGVVLDSETGMKYSKRLKNYKDPKEVMDAYGADALRWLMLASPVMRGMDISVDPEGKFIRDVVRLAIKPIWNAYNFFTMYANADGIKANDEKTDSTHLMDRYILAKCNAATAQIKASLDAYDTPGACDAVLEFFEVLNNWYIRRSKERFWKEEKDADKQAAYDTLYNVLATMCKAAAPLLPFTTEFIYTGLTGEESVHLADFPAASHAVQDDELIRDMDWAQSVCNAALAIRNKLNIRVRQPLAKLQVVGKVRRLGPLLNIICDEVNVKSFRTDETGDIEKYATLKLSINSQVLGKRLPTMMKQILPASKKGEWKQVDGVLEICGEKLLSSEYMLQLEPKPEYKDNAQALSTNDALVILDVNITPELQSEGLARDLVRMIQQARKDAGLNISDRIELSIHGDAPLVEAASLHSAYITEQTLSNSIVNEIASNDWYKVEQSVDDKPVTIGLRKVA